MTGFDKEEIERLITQTYQGDEPEPDVSDPGINCQSQYGVIVICTSEGEQERVYNQLNELGFSCRVVSV